MLKIAFQESLKSSAKTETLVFLVGTDKKLSAQGIAADKQAGGALAKALKASPKFTGKAGEFVTVAGPAQLNCERVVLAGYGKDKAPDMLTLELVGGALAAHLDALGAQSGDVLVELGKGSADASARMGFAAQLRSWRFDKYRTKQSASEKPSLVSLTFITASAKQATASFGKLEKITGGVFLTRELVTEPANIIHPETMAERCLELKKSGVDVEVLGEAEMHALGMHSLLGVGQGSNKESQLVIMRWNGAKNRKEAPIAFVGKGVTFDTGGISIKPAAGMEEMKWDMGGAGTVIGLMRVLASRKANVNAIGVVGLVENMPDGNAQRPGDVVRSMSGQTIEVINTDAEGRLVLADALWYTQERYKPKLIVDLATLTGAIIIALGYKKAGLFSNNDKLASQLQQSGAAVGEELWRLPLDDYYDKLLASDIADMKNVVDTREAGSITAAQFLQRFIKDGVAWAHLDIAGVAWSKKSTATIPKGATAFGVRLLDRLVADHYE